MATVNAALVPLEVYLRTTYRPDRDWIDGETKERNVGEGPHAVIQKFLAMYLGSHEEEWDILVRTEQRVQTSTTQFRIPDVCVTQGSEPFEAIVTTPPLLCIEILSRDDRMNDMQERIDDYLAMGVENIWVIDPRLRQLYATDVAGSVSSVQHALEIAGTPIRLDAETLFKQLNKLVGLA
ncbi:protein of unknown function DUF820 [Granulicella sibirica]|uniref:Putative restriction endonuclease domain-containing protein n=1 Tax=Granulicella sibirica TaxID=2479048 RepID=A0A4Q0T197_9BACT|nr:protein of unknown function DUF820 [Granulicella sibirica]